jgi:hypothetical protein
MKTFHQKPVYLYELKATFRTYFESQLATYILRQHPKLAAVNKISKRILSLIKQNNASAILQLITANPKIGEELYNHTLFGRLGETVPAPAQILADIKQILSDYLANDNTAIKLEQVMHIQSVFYYRIYESLPNKLIKQDESHAQAEDYTLSELIAHMSANAPSLIEYLHKSLTLDFKKTNCKDRGRSTQINNNASCKSILGNCKNCFFNNTLSGITHTKAATAHQPAMHIYQPNTESSYYQKIQAKDLPYIAGRSTHTLSFILAATRFGNLSQAEMQEYFLAILGYLMGGGNHTFDEIAYVAHLLADVPYVEGSYQHSLPAAFVTGLREYLKSIKQNYSGAILLAERFLAEDESNSAMQRSSYYYFLLNKYLDVYNSFVKPDLKIIGHNDKLEQEVIYVKTMTVN